MLVRVHVQLHIHARVVNFSCLTGKCYLTSSHEPHRMQSKKDTAEQSAGSNLFLEVCSSKLQILLPVIKYSCFAEPGRSDAVEERIVCLRMKQKNDSNKN